MIPVAENSLQIESELMHKIIEFCDEHESIAGISNPYSKINYTKSCYEQAAKAIRLAPFWTFPGTCLNIEGWHSMTLLTIRAI